MNTDPTCPLFNNELREASERASASGTSGEATGDDSEDEAVGSSLVQSAGRIFPKSANRFGGGPAAGGIGNGGA